ncbi:cytochrome c oxidase, subunit II [Opitutaceae bacterium TAV1]|nr:cytochrome c oxidase, subunit II [Opitutaceae bacterium TAV1]
MSAVKAFRFILRRCTALTVISLLPLFLGGWSWRWLSGPQSTIDVAGPVARAQTQVFYVTLWVTGIIFVIVAAVLAYATLKFKARSSADEHAPTPPQGHGNPLVELSLIGASVLALVFIAVPTLRAIWYQYDVPEEEKANALEVTATGYQWWFKFDYQQEQIDGAGDLATANELVIPAGRPVRVNLRSTDVIHSFWVPKLAGKVDMIPNRGNHLWLLAEQPGYFWGQCAEYCGESHAVMRFRVVALPEEEFAAWVANQKKPARTVNDDNTRPRVQTAGVGGYVFRNPGRNAPGYSAEFDADPLLAWKRLQAPEAGEDVKLIARGREIFREKNCITCHTTRGHDGVGVNGPDLTHVGSRTTIAGGVLENTAENLHRWVTHPDLVKPGNKMYVGLKGMDGYVTLDPNDGRTISKHNITVNDDEARALVAYLHSLK